MIWSSEPKPLLEPHHEDWQLAGWRWLIDCLGERCPLERTALVLPNFDFFPATDAEGHALAEHLFEHVARLMNVEAQAFDLVPHDDFPEGVDHGDHVAGTFSVSEGARMTVTYHPRLLEEPTELIGVLSHEIAHGIMRTFDSAPPGGWEMEEFATELTTAYFGFGLFGANKAFQTRTSSDWWKWFGGVTISTSGYLSQEHWAFALAVFLRLRGEDPAAAEPWLGPVLKKMLKRGLAYVDARPDVLASLKP